MNKLTLAAISSGLRRATIERLHRDPTPKEEAKLRKLADRIQKATEEQRITVQKA